MGRFEKVYDELKGAVEHIESAISGSEIDSDLNFIEEKVKELKLIRNK